VASHEITIAWTASPSPISGYNVYRGTASGNESTVPINGSKLVTTNSYVDDTVFSGVTYFYEITAVLNGVESLDSIEVRSTPVPFPPEVTEISIGAATSFGVLAASTVTNVPGSATSIVGDVGVYPGTSITGFAAPTEITGVFHVDDFVSQAGQAAALAAYNQMVASVNPAGLPSTTVTNTYPVTSVATATSGAALYTGTFPTTSLIGQSFTVTGFTNGINNGTFLCSASTITTITLNNAGAVAETATASATTSVTTPAPSVTTLTGDIGGQTLLPGVYNSQSSLGITGDLFLDAQGDTNAVWVFQIGSTLTTATNNSAVVLLNGAQASNVFWAVGSSATLGTGTAFAGTIIAQASITANTGASVNGRLIALTGAVTLNNNSIALFLPTTLLLNGWTALTPFHVGQAIYDCASGTLQIVTVSGISGASRPAFSTVLGGTTQDGTVTWTDPPVTSLDILLPLPPSPPNVPPPRPAAPLNPHITSEM